MTTPDKRRELQAKFLLAQMRDSEHQEQWPRLIVQSLNYAFLEGLEEAAKIAEKNEPSEKATEVLRCNPKEAKKPYIDSATLNGYDWACDDIAQAIRTRANEVKNAT